MTVIPDWEPAETNDPKASCAASAKSVTAVDATDIAEFPAAVKRP